MRANRADRRREQGGGRIRAEDARSSPRGLVDLLDSIEDAARGKDRVSTRVVVHAVGERSFGALLVIPGLVTLAPIIGDIPGVPTLMALLVALVAVQMLFGRQHFWLPAWLLNRSVAHDKVSRVIGWLRPVARFLDRISKGRLTAITHGAGVRLIALACAMIAAAMPPMEIIPFSANAAGAALTLFGLALIAHDGLLAWLGLAVSGGAMALVVMNL